MILDQIKLTFETGNKVGVSMGDLDTYEGRKSKTARLLDEFKAKGRLTTRDIYRYGTGCSSRLAELRREGHEILAYHIKGSSWEYIYKGEKNVR